MTKRLRFVRQAEDGIRDMGVTGVQTCALPILAVAAGARVLNDPTNPGFGAGQNRGIQATAAPYVLLVNPDARVVPAGIARSSEERRAGKERRSRWPPYP